MMIKWGGKQYQRFFQWYGHYELLWNKHHPDYKDQELKQNAIRDIMSKMGIRMEVLEMKMKIKNIRTMYCRELNKIRERQARGERVVTKLPWFKLAHRILKSTVQNNIAYDEEEEQGDDNAIETYQNDEESRASEPEEPSSPAADEDQPPPPKKARIFFSRPDKEPPRRPFKKHEPCSTCAISNYLRRRDEAEITAKAWAIELEKMDEMQQLYAKKAISDILIEGRMGRLQPARAQSEYWDEGNAAEDSDGERQETKHNVSASSNPFASI